MQKTLGGDRLGSGNKMKVTLHGYERTTFNLSKVLRTTMSPGTLVPFLCKPALPGDTWDIDLAAYMNTHPTIGPGFLSFKWQFDIFVAPIRLYQGVLHNNALYIGKKMADVKLPLMELTARGFDRDDMTLDIDNIQINPSCLLSYLGLRGIGHVAPVDTSATRQFNACGVLMYWDVVKNYYSNKQEEIGVVIHTPVPALVNTVTSVVLQTPGGVVLHTIPQAPTSNIYTPFEVMRILLNYTGATPIPEQILISTSLGIQPVSEFFDSFFDNGAGSLVGVIKTQYTNGEVTFYNWDFQTANQPITQSPQLVTFPLTNIDDVRTAILAEPISSPFILDSSSPEPYKFLFENSATISNAITQSQEGLAVKTYQSDLFNNWINTDWIDGAGGITEVTSIDTTGGSFSIDTLNISKKVYYMLNRIAVSGGSYKDWIDTVYQQVSYWQVESPVYLGGLSKEVIFQEVVSNTETTGQPLGTLAGKGTLSQKHKGGKVVIKVDEPSYIMGIMSLTPRIDYSQGNAWDVNLKTMDDFHKPQLDQIGFQESITEMRAWWDTSWDSTPGEWVQKSAGKVPAWINYMTDVNETRGNFAIGTRPDAAVGEMFMTNNRRYEADANGIKDLTTYIDPVKYNYLFAETALDAQNFWAQIGMDITARRLMSGKQIPTV